MTIIWAAAKAILLVLSVVTVADAKVVIKADFAGGNVIVQNNAGDTINIAPDLRGGKPWFYWYFEATADKPGRVTFILPAKRLPIGMQGPSVSLDLGKTWKWAGTDRVKENTFFYDFTKAGQKVRFAVTIPYLQSNLDAFLKENKDNPHLTRSVLTRSLKGRDVELLQVGQPGADKRAVLFTARHHACETMASFVLEGFLKTVISDTPEAVAFRKNYILYVVPFVDKDGVEQGDQGKNRSPHDHNRDYGKDSLYPEIDAIKALNVSKNIRFVMDYHCPTLRMADHQHFYFVGPRSVPVSNMANVSAFAKLIDREFPPQSPGGPFNWMTATNNPTMCTSYFGIQPKMIMSVALEVPYAPLDKNMDAASGLLYGAAILRAWMGMKFEYSPEYLLTVNNGSGDGSYIAGRVVNITADRPPAGEVFDAWIGAATTVTNIYDPTITVTMPAAEVNLTATYKQPGTLYPLAVNGGTGSGRYSKNTVVDIVAAPPAEGQEFSGWTGNAAYLTDANESATSITMPAQTVNVTATYQKATLDLLAWWEMEETDGDDARDSTGNGYSLAPLGGSTISDATTVGKIGKGFTFNGDGDRFTHPTLLDVLPEEITIAGWVKPDATDMNAGQCWFSKQNAGGMGEQLWLKFNMSSGAPGAIGASFRSDGVFKNLNSSVTWMDDAWYHYAFTWDSSGAKLYINGKLEGSNATGIMGNGTAIDLSIGTGGHSSQPFKGVIDDVRIYEDVLNAREIANLYNRTSGAATVTNENDPATSITIPAQETTVTATNTPASSGSVTIRTDFPGGNVLVERKEGSTIHIAPDLRGGKPWFYWYFEATANKPGRVTFVLPAKMSGFTGPPISMQGPAVSLDLGKTWKWAGTDRVKENTFFYDFTKAGQKVRFAVTIPYLQSNLDAFLKENKDNPHLTRSVLTRSLKGRDVELLQVGQPGADKRAVLFTARHHACETMASFVLEGFLKTVISDTPEAVAFRKNYILYVVPFVDKDGVEQGDQGKNRSPHDHNRDYGKGSLYPEVDAIEKLAEAKNIQFLQDYHCPTLRYGDHQVMYFVGTRQTPSNNERNVKEFARLIKEGLPPKSPAGPLVWLKNRTPMPSGGNCNRYFSFRKGAIMVSTIEVPYAPPGKIMDAEQCSKIGVAMSNAWSKAKFLSDGEKE